MNSTLEKALVEILNKTTEAVSAGVSFLSAQLPDVIHQLLVFKLAWSSSMFFFCVFVIGLLVVGWFKIIIPVERAVPRSEKGLITFIGFILSAIGGTPAVLGALNYFRDILLITLAPKIYLIEYAASLMKGN